MEEKKRMTGRIFKAAISFILVAVMLFAPLAETAAYTGSLGTVAAYAADTYKYTYYPKYTGKSGSIVTALKAVGVDSSYSNRAKIAKVNGITNYKGTAAQNIKMLNLLKSGKLIKSKTKVESSSKTTAYYPKYTGKSGSIVTALKAVGVDSSYSNRAKIAKANGITNYKGTAAQNTTLLNLLKKGKLVKVGSTAPATPKPEENTESASKVQKLKSVSEMKAAFKKKLGSSAWLDQHSSKFDQDAGGFCCACAYAAGIYLVTGNVNKPTKYTKSAHNAYTYYKDGHVGGFNGGYWAKKNSSGDHKIALAAYKNLQKGLPTMLHYYSKGAEGGHWVLVIGVRPGKTASDVKLADLIIYNPNGATEGYLNSGATNFECEGYRSFTK